MTDLHAPLSEAAIAQLFTEARTYNAWQDREVTDEQLHRIYDLAKLGPTSANTCPMRIVFVRSPAAKATLEPLLDPNNRKKTMAAPVTAIIGADHEFYERLPELFPHADARSWFVGNQPLIDATAFRNGSLQGAYLLMAARALGVDSGGMSGFDVDGVTRAFFAGTAVRANFLLNLGYGDATRDFWPRKPRLGFDEVAKIL